MSVENSPLNTDLNPDLSQCMIADRHGLQRLVQAIRKQQKVGKPFDRLQKKLSEQLAASRERVQQRRACVPQPTYDDALPISQKRDAIKALIEAHQVVVLAGETGSGKTTQIPKICLELGLGARGLIGHTQPRRLAARAVAARIAEELRSELGQHVGYQVRFSDCIGPDSYVKLMTDGILLAELQQDRFLEQYEVLIIDEAHERSLNIDFLLGFLKRLLPKRPDLKVIITSATIDLERFSKHFDNAPVIEVSGRTYPVETRYRPLDELLGRENDESGAGQDGDQNQGQGILAAIRELEAGEKASKRSPGDILVFLSGEREIRETAELLRRASLRHTQVLPLYARLSQSEQNRIFHPSGGGRRIVLSTNVAETSLTVPGIRYVIDPGFARISRYSYRSKVQRLPIEPISQASANQRKGRCGRVAEGICIRLYSEEDFLARSEFTDAEIRRTNLASVILQMLSMGLGEIGDFPFIDPPDSRYINDGLKLLQELGAIEGQARLTALGRKLAKLPVDPRIGRMIIAAAELGCLREVLVIASALSVQDPRERPLDRQQAADEQHRQHRHDESDFLSFWNLWQHYEEQRQNLSQNQLRKYCQKAFLSFMRMREWRDVHRQLHLACKEMGWKENAESADYPSVHRALLAGLLSHIGLRQEERDFLGARNRRFLVFPGSVLAKRSPKWVMAAELVETSRLFARTVARIDPEWVEPLAGHLVKRQYQEPHWERKRAQVVAYEQVSLYGMVIVTRRKVNFGKIEPDAARQIFIREALVEGDYQTRAPFFTHNRQLLQSVEDLEDKARRRDILVDEERLFEFYNERLLKHNGQTINSGASFEQWRKRVEKDDPKLLFLDKAYLMQHGAEQVTQAQFPDHWLWKGMRFRLHYQFEPGQAADGVTIEVPVGALSQLPQSRLEWLVPGMLRDKCIALIKSLPKPLRKNFVPVPNFVDAFLAVVTEPQGSLTEMLATHLRKMTGVRIAPEDWSEDKLESHLLFNLRVVDENGKLLGQGRDWHALCGQFADQAKESLQSGGDSDWGREGIVRWDFGELATVVELKQAGMTLESYPALVDCGQSVKLCLCDLKEEADQKTRAGLNRLVRLALPEQVKHLQRKLPHLERSALLYARIDNKQQFIEDFIYATIERAFFPKDSQGQQPLPRNGKQFEDLLQTGRSKLIEEAESLDRLVYELLFKLHAIHKRMKGQISLAWTLVFNDIRTQLDALFFKGFLAQVSSEWLCEYPRYLTAIEERLDKFQNHLNRERMLIDELQGFWEPYRALVKARGRYRRCEALDLFRWMLEEYRVSLFAQKLGTKLPVSSKRLRQQWLCCQQE